MDHSPAHDLCSFCGAEGTPGVALVGALGAMMCLGCLDHYHAAVHAPGEPARQREPRREDLSDAQLLDTLPLILRSSEQVASFATDWVTLIRSRGISWTAVGKVLGVSRQAAAQRFGKPGAPSPRADES